MRVPVTLRVLDRTFEGSPIRLALLLVAAWTLIQASWLVYALAFSDDRLRQGT